MNNIYQSIWNAKSGTFVAASEHAKSGGKNTAGASKIGANCRVSFALKALAASVMLGCGFNVYALPTGGSVAAGSASIAESPGSTTVTQTSQNVSINWQSFNIGQSEAVNFAQPNSSAIALNRVLGADPSSILGSLNANGQVFLINPNGVLFGNSASVNVGGLVASTRDITDSDFMAGQYKFNGTGDGSVVNQGSIKADGGYVALLGARVSNQGVIQANLGSVALAAGDAITLDVAGDGLLNVAVDQGAVGALVQNGGLIQADGGKVLMTARSAGDLFQSSVNNTGVVRAQSIENRNGTITLLGDMNSGTVNVGGTLDVSGSGAGETGGSVTATARHVGLVDAKIDASGDAGGGTVLLGGGYQGKNPAVKNASAAYMSADSRINADAVTNGDGGTVVLWGNESTRAYGSISARGGSESGNGGLIETSGGWLDVSGARISTSAAYGLYGMWLLDPADITISSAATTGATSTNNVFAPDSGVSVANINVNDLVTSLGGTNITVTTENTGASGTGNGDITVMDAVTWVAPTTLTLNAARDINVNADITGTLGSLATIAGRDINVDADITTTTGNLSFLAFNNVSLNAPSTITTGNLTAVAGHNVSVGAAMTVTTGDIILRADNDGTGPGALSNGTVLITCGSNCITIGTGELSIRFNPVSYSQTNAEILAYDLNLTGGGMLDAKAWVFGLGDDKVYDGLRDATVSGLEPDVTNSPPPVALGAVTNAQFDTKNVGSEKLITYDSTFSDPVYALFAPYGTTVGSYVTRADITPAALTIKANDATKVFGDTLVLGTSAFTSVGLVPGETVGGVTLTSAGTVATASVDGNPYAITASDAVPGSFDPRNYNINYVDGALLITQVVPVDPTVPVVPVIPVIPVVPVDPTVPVVPVDPVIPVAPVDPTVPVVPVDPVIPVAPVDPTVPVGPGVPAEPVDPVEPPTDATPPGSTPPGSTPPESTAPDFPVSTVVGVTRPSTTSPYDDVSGRPFVSAPPIRATRVNFKTEGAGVNMPVVQLTQLNQPQPPARPLVIEEKAPPAVYIPPVYPPRQDRN